MNLSVPLFIWCYILSVVLCPNIWGKIYQSIIDTFDLTPGQASVIPVVLNGFITVFGFHKTVQYLLDLRNKKPVIPWKHIAGVCAIAGTGLVGYVTIVEVINYRKHAQLVSAAQNHIFNAGKIKDGKYSNSLVGLSITLPTRWQSQSLNAIRRDKISGAFQIANGHTGKAEQLLIPSPGVTELLTIRKFLKNYPGYNPSLYMAAYDKTILAKTSAIKDLNAFAEIHTRLDEPYRVIGGAFETLIGNAKGYRIHVVANFPTATVQQYVYLVESDRHYIILTASCMEDDDGVELNKAISTLVLTK